MGCCAPTSGHRTAIACHRARVASPGAQQRWQGRLGNGRAMGCCAPTAGHRTAIACHRARVASPGAQHQTGAFVQRAGHGRGARARGTGEGHGRGARASRAPTCAFAPLRQSLFASSRLRVPPYLSPPSCGRTSNIRFARGTPRSLSANAAP